MLYNSGYMWPSVVVHEHWPASQRMIVEMGDYAWSEHIVTVFLSCQITLTLRHRHARFDWSHDHLGWTIRIWRRVHWSDESRFLLRPTDGRARVWRQRNTSLPPNAILPRSAAAVLNGRCRARLDMSQSSLGVVLLGLPARGRSVTFLIGEN
jgi:hypothetical protein